MARGIAAFIFLVSLVFSMSILGGLGFYGMMGINTDVEGQNEGVQRAAAQLEGISYDEDRSSAILQGPLAVVIPVVNLVMTFVTVIGNTSGVIQLLFGAPPEVADTIQTFFRIAILITIGYLVRGAVF